MSQIKTSLLRHAQRLDTPGFKTRIAKVSLSLCVCVRGCVCVYVCVCMLLVDVLSREASGILALGSISTANCTTCKSNIDNVVRSACVAAQAVHT